MNYPGAYKVEGKEFKEFKEMDDDKALKTVVLIYNVKCDTWEEGIARSIALEQYMALLGKRKSAYIRNSGVFDMKYDKVKLASWKDEDLMKLHDALESKTGAYYMNAAPELTESENARRIAYLTATNSIETEMRRRNNTRGALTVAGQLLLTALSVALAMV